MTVSVRDRPDACRVPGSWPGSLATFFVTASLKFRYAVRHNQSATIPRTAAYFNPATVTGSPATVTGAGHPGGCVAWLWLGTVSYFR